MMHGYSLSKLLTWISVSHKVGVSTQPVWLGVSLELAWGVSPHFGVKSHRFLFPGVEGVACPGVPWLGVASHMSWVEGVALAQGVSVTESFLVHSCMCWNNCSFSSFRSSLDKSRYVTSIPSLSPVYVVTDRLAHRLTWVYGGKKLIELAQYTYNIIIFLLHS